MKRQFLREVILLFIALVAIQGATGRGQDRGNSGTFAGTWHLVSLEQPGSDGQLHRIDCDGLLVITVDGHFSVQVMDRGAQAQATPGPEQYSKGGYEASYGTYVLNQRAHTFVFRVEGALVRSLVGKDLPRSFELSGNTLIVKSTHADEHWRVTWERYQ